jgi:hypothetical protein
MLLKRAIIFVLTLIILFADSGQTIYAHTCLKSKHTHISIGQPKHCCAESKTTSHCTIKKSNCCEVSSKYLKQDFINQQTETKAVELEVAVLPVTHVFVLVEEETLVLNYNNTSPPLVFSKSENTFTQTFRI